MNRLPPNGRTSSHLFAPIRFKDFDVSWAGPNPFQQGFGFGSEDGRLVFTDEAGALTPFSAPMNGSVSGEAVNGIARSGATFAVSSRREITLRTWTPAPDRWTVTGFPHGAHGITATSGGYFVAPLGRSGIMMLRANSNPDDPVGVISSDKKGMYFYRVLALPGRNGRDLLVCAARQGGIGITEVQWGQDTYNMRVATFDDLDVVDVCSIGGAPDAPAIAGVRRDGAIILVRDALHDDNPLVMKFDNVQGTAYRLLSARGHLFLLTSLGLYGLMHLGDRLLQGLSQGKFTTPVLVVPMEAVDANIVGERWLLVIMPDEVRKFDIEGIHESTPEGLRDGEIREVTPHTFAPQWQVGESQQRSKQLVGAI